MVLDLLKFVKSAMKNFDQSEASIGSHMTKKMQNSRHMIWKYGRIAENKSFSNVEILYRLIDF